MLVVVAGCFSFVRFAALLFGLKAFFYLVVENDKEMEATLIETSNQSNQSDQRRSSETLRIDITINACLLFNNITAVGIPVELRNLIKLYYSKAINNSNIRIAVNLWDSNRLVASILYGLIEYWDTSSSDRNGSFIS